MNIKKTKNADIELSKKSKLNESDFDPSSIGHRISIVIPEDVLMGFREEAKKRGIGYQTLMNQILRKFISPNSILTLEDRVTKLEKIIKKKRSGT